MILAISACSSTSTDKQIPSWVDKPSSVFPQSQYLSAVGAGRDAEQAKVVALANLSKIFSVSISEEQIDKSSFSSEQGKTNSDITRSISSKAEQQLKGAVIKETYQDEQGQYYAIAVLAKSPTAQAFRVEIKQLDSKVAYELNYAKNDAPNFLKALKALEQAHLAQQQRENDNRNLLVVAPTGIPTSISSNDIEQLIKQSLAKLSFKIESQNSFLAKQLNSSAANLGVKLSQSSKLILSGKLEQQPAIMKNGWYWLRGNLHIGVADGENTLQQMVFPFKVSAQQKSMLQPRLQDYLAENLDNYILKTIFKK